MLPLPLTRTHTHTPVTAHKCIKPLFIQYANWNCSSFADERVLVQLYLNGLRITACSGQQILSGLFFRSNLTQISWIIWSASEMTWRRQQAAHPQFFLLKLSFPSSPGSGAKAHTYYRTNDDCSKIMLCFNSEGQMLYWLYRLTISLPTHILTKGIILAERKKKTLFSHLKHKQAGIF